jgi:helicase SWR1
MPETASTANVLPKSDPDAIKTEQDALEGHENGVDALQGTMDSHDETNGDAPATENHHEPNGYIHDDERPAKRRRTRDSTPPQSTPKKMKPVSPPWKKISADGPTSYTENGRRKSGRINTLLPEPSPPSKNRTSRRSTGANSTPKTKAEIQLTNGNSRKMPNGSHKASPATKTSSKQAPASTPKSASKKPAETRTSSRSTRRRSPSPPPPPQNSTRSRRSARFSDAVIKEEPEQDTRTAPSNSTHRSPRTGTGQRYGSSFNSNSHYQP